MNACLVDTNVFLDYLLERDGFDEAKEVINFCFNKDVIGYVSAHEITTISYYLERFLKDRGRVISSISKILKAFKIIETNEKTLGMALFSNVADYEDAVIEVAAIERNLDYIITKNIKDFEKSRVKAILPGDFLSLIEKGKKKHTFNIQIN